MLNSITFPNMDLLSCSDGHRLGGFHFVGQFGPFRQPIAISDISVYICLIDIRSKSKEQLNERRAGLSNIPPFPPKLTDYVQKPLYNFNRKKHSPIVDSIRALHGAVCSVCCNFCSQFCHTNLFPEPNLPGLHFVAPEAQFARSDLPGAQFLPQKIKRAQNRSQVVVMVMVVMVVVE